MYRYNYPNENEKSSMNYPNVLTTGNIYRYLTITYEYTGIYKRQNIKLSG